MMPDPSTSDLPLLDDSPDTLRARIAALETRLATMEGQLDQVTRETTDRIRAEEELRHYAEALAYCSRILLTPIETAEAFQQALIQTLNVVCEAVGADRITLARYLSAAPGEAPMLRSPQVLAAATRPGLPPLPPLTPEENADLPRVLNLCQQDGESYNGPVAGHFPNHPRYQRYSTVNRIQSMYLQSLNVGKRWWWFINAIDHRQTRSWGVDAIQLIQTAAEMIVTFAEGWETMQALQERETLLCSVNGALPSAFLFQIIHHNSGGLRQITYISPSAEHMLGRSVTELSAKPYPIRDLIHPKDHARFIAADQESDRSGKPFDIEARMIKADGQIGWFHIRAEMVRMLDMQRSLWNGVAMEVTAQKEAKQALATQLRYAEALARCSRTLLIAGAAIPAWGPVVQQALAALREAVGCVRLSFNLYPSRETFLLQHAEVVANQDPTAPPHQAIPFHMEDIPPAVLATISSGGYAVGSSAVLFPEGSNARRHYDMNGAHAILLIGVLLGGQLRGYLSASDHIEGQTWGEPAIRLLRTGLEMIAAFIQQWETASALRTREAQLRALGDNLPNGYIYQLHRDQNWQPCFTYLSSGVEQVLGVRPEDGLRDPGEFYRIMLPEDVARVDVMAAHAAANGNDLKEIVRYHRANGELRWLYLCSRPRHQPNGCVVWDGVVLDITERQRAAEELAHARDVAEAATQAKSAFLASMSHEIRTPLNAVIGMTTMLQETALSAEQRFYVDTIHTGGEALLAVISDILDFSRIESGRIELEVVPFDLHACLGSTIDLIAHSARAKELFVSWTLAPEVPQVVVGDSSRLRQILLNLLGNAIKFTSQGHVTLDVDVEAGEGNRASDFQPTSCILFTVRDTGIGMPPEQLARVFAPFVQAEISTARRYGGSGLGLTISQQLVALMGGTIAATSVPGIGSTFTVNVPFVHASLDDLPRPAAPMPAGSRLLRVLVAEDNPINQEVVRCMLSGLGHTVAVVGDGQAALDAVSQQPYDVVLMDMQMPLLNGDAATQQIRECGAGIVQPHIIALTASTLDEDRERALRAGMDDYLSKPVQLDDLRHALMRVTQAGSSQ